MVRKELQVRRHVEYPLDAVCDTVVGDAGQHTAQAAEKGLDLLETDTTPVDFY